MISDSVECIVTTAIVLVDEVQRHVFRCTRDGQHATNVLESRKLVVAVVYAWGQTIVGPMLCSTLGSLCCHHVVAGGGRHVRFGSTLRPYPGSFKANQGAWAPQIMDEQAAGAENAVVTGSHEVVRDVVIDAIFPRRLTTKSRRPRSPPRLSRLSIVSDGLR